MYQGAEGLVTTICGCILMVSSITSIAESKPYKKHSKNPEIPLSRTPTQLSMYVRLAEVKPELPPWEYEEKASNRTRKSRSVSSHLAQSVCDSVSRWEEKETVVDMWGNELYVVKNIQVGATTVSQYFYETYCAGGERIPRSCRGINTSLYTSECETKHIWAYAQVRTRNNEVGWTLVKIRGSCNCLLKRKRSDINNILSSLRKR